MSGRPYAHSANQQGERQLLVDHLKNVASLARSLASPIGGGDLAFLAGLWHDAGKANPLWQRRLDECENEKRKRIGVDHKCAGVLLAEELGGDARSVGLLIHGHHGGLGNPRHVWDWFNSAQQLPGPKRAIAELQTVMPEIQPQHQPDIPKWATEDPLEAEMFIRFVYSALVDADSLDTETHFHDIDPSHRGSDVTIADLWSRYRSFLAEQPPSRGTRVNRVRQEVHDACLAAARKPQGVFRLTVPTGGGKTRSGMAFALRHARHHGLRRVVVAVPFTTITQQTADVYRRIFGDDRAVLEHHSALAPRTGETSDGGGAAEDEGSFTDEGVWRRLAAQNWDAPVVVTTTVQLFESLFSNRRSKARKLHNLANSVVVLDEAQALPAGLLAPILHVLRQLCAHYGVSVVLSTATQPAFDSIEEFRTIEAHEIVPDHADHFQLLKRVEYEWKKTRQQWIDIAREMRSERQVLTIVNTKRHAMELLDALELLDAEDGSRNWNGTLHLSTLLCGAHRAKVLQEIRRMLDAGEPCRVVSTQVVEAGVDVDFPVVFRAEAPLDAIIQAAGRCNREGKLGPTGGRVVVFRPPDDASPRGVYRSGRDLTRVLRELPEFDPDDPKVVHRYTEWLFGTSVDPDSEGIQSLRKALNFPEVADKFRMIRDDTRDVIVGYPNDETIESLVEMLQAPDRSPRQTLRELQPYMVSIHRREFERLRARGYIEPLDHGIGRWCGSYDPTRGIIEADPERIV